MNSNVRKLIEQLGEAIHESVSESEQIAGVVQDIRSQGFDVLLMLEATIGLNEVEQQPGMEEDASKPEVVEGGEPFTAQDVSFLRSLRISFDKDTGRVEADDDTSGPLSIWRSDVAADILFGLFGSTSHPVSWLAHTGTGNGTLQEQAALEIF